MPSLSLSLILSILLVVHTRRSLGAVDNEILTPGSDVMIRHNKDGRKSRDPVVSIFDGAVGDGDGELIVEKRLEMSVEEFYVEHEISQKEARAAAQKLDLSQFGSSSEAAGCAPCSESELAYCGGAALLGDHCCCERRHREPYGHVPHTCYAGRARCRTVAADCAQYARLRACCCDQLVGEKYKALFSSASVTSPSTRWCLLLTASLLMTV